MKRFELVILFFISLVVVVGVATLQPVPGYMDADYYYAGGVSLFSGKGFSDPFLWNYLDDPTALPHPSHTYWMPLPSLLAWLGMVLLGRSDFLSARVWFLLMASLIAPLTAWLSFRLTGRRVSGWIAGGLAVFSGYYMVFVGLVETFAITMLGGAACLILITSNLKAWKKYLFLGLLMGCLHLTRADGLMWLVLGGLGLTVQGKREKWQAKQAVLVAGVLLAGYLAVMGAWYMRNLSLFGSLFPPGSGRVMWATEYDQMFSYPPGLLSFDAWLSAGLGPIMIGRWDALLANLQSTLAVEALIFLLPLILVGLWRLRKKAIIRLAGLMWLVLFSLMTLIFPLAGSRGGFFHAAAGVQVVFWAAAPAGLEAFIDIGVRRRNWKMDRAIKGFGFLFVLVAFLFSLGLVWVRTMGETPNQPAWGKYWRDYQQVDAALISLGAKPGDRVIVNNPPGYFNVNQRGALMIPNGDEHVVRQVAQKFDVRYLILDENSVKPLGGRYLQPGSGNGLTLIDILGMYQIYRIEP